MNYFNNTTVPTYPRPFAIGNGAAGPLSLSLENGNELRLWYQGAPGGYILANIGSINSQLLDWAHFAVVRKTTGAVNVYINGVSYISTTIPNVTGGSGSQFVIGNWESSSQANAQFNGYITNFRVIITLGVGGAIYTTNFTPPTAPLPYTSNTKLLMNVVSDPLKYRYVDSQAANKAPSFTTVGTAPTFAALSDPL